MQLAAKRNYPSSRRMRVQICRLCLPALTHYIDLGCRFGDPPAEVRSMSPSRKQARSDLLNPVLAGVCPLSLLQVHHTGCLMDFLAQRSARAPATLLKEWMGSVLGQTAVQWSDSRLPACDARGLPFSLVGLVPSGSDLISKTIGAAPGAGPVAAPRSLQPPGSPPAHQTTPNSNKF